MIIERKPNTGTNRYYASMVAFFALLGMLLLTVVDIRRGFLFPKYFTIGAPSTLFNLEARHLPMLLVGGLGLWLTYSYMSRFEQKFEKSGLNLETLSRLVAVIIGVLLVIDLFTYRIVPASRNIAAGKMGVGTGTMGISRAIPVTSFPEWLQPLAEGVNYLLLVWHATVLGILLGGLFLVAGSAIVLRLKSKGIASHLAATAMALPMPFCSCCAAPLAASLYRRGVGLGPVLTFMVSAPLLNITSWILALTFLPIQFALLRIVGGIIIGVFVTYAASLISAKWAGREEAQIEPGRVAGFFSRLSGAYSRLFQFDLPFNEDNLNSPTALLSAWLVTAYRLAKVMIPVLLLSSILASYLMLAMPLAQNSVTGVILASAFGTVLMVPTWTEIPLAAAMVNSGLTGVAAALLLTLPAVSLPCLAIIAGAVRSLKVALILGLSVFVAGIIAGMIFL